MRVSIKMADKKVVYDNVNTLFIPFDDSPVLIHEAGDTFPVEKLNISSIKVESDKLKKEEENANTS